MASDFDSRLITLTGAGFTKAFFPNAPLLKEALKLTVDYQQYDRKRSGTRRYDAYLPILEKYNSSDTDIERLFSRYFDLGKDGPKNTEEKNEMDAIKYLKFAFLHVIDVLTLGDHVPKEEDCQNFNEYAMCKRFKELSEYFAEMRGKELQVTVNYDTLLERILGSFPEPEDHDHQIQHLHGSRGWYIRPETNKTVSEKLDGRSYSSVFKNEPLILPINRKERLSKNFEWYGKKQTTLTTAFETCKKLTIIGCGLHKRDTELLKMVQKIPPSCEVIYISNSCKRRKEVEDMFSKQKLDFRCGGFVDKCLD